MSTGSGGRGLEEEEKTEGRDDELIVPLVGGAIVGDAAMVEVSDVADELKAGLKSWRRLAAKLRGRLDWAYAEDESGRPSEAG